MEYVCTCSFLEIYNERIYDLLETNCNGKNLREDVKMGVHVEGLTEVSVENPSEAMKVRQAIDPDRQLAKLCLLTLSQGISKVFTLFLRSFLLLLPAFF